MTPWPAIVTALRTHGTCAMVTVLDVAGSAPREPGARMVVAPDLTFSGTIGGGTLEYQVIHNAAEAAAAGQDRFAVQRFSLGPDLGQCCGGRVSIAIETFTRNRLAEATRMAELGEGPFATVLSVDPAGNVGARHLLDDPAERTFGLHAGELVERFGDTPTPVMLFGAGHVGKTLVLALAMLPFKVEWIDSRADVFPAAVPRNVTCRTAERPEELVGMAAPGTLVLIMTHSHAQDLAIADAALHLAAIRHVGMIGSATKAARMRSRLRAAGHGEAALAHFVCPIGIAGISSKEPAVIAASVTADLLMRREVLSSVVDTTVHNYDGKTLAHRMRAG
ncbi:xanthine dehydrogenase accessory protein XdhC [Stappia taiwanensis]|uniref:Xanthine dehydrogenase accessory protein XdhC n=1 Tax=Stappia taiwanensis TaxID=992267 RepID=A0A838XS43_9HYPH|nr:xanthine dehydrogenase accessory protein XdhC [Stappia taiwanensis]MBA4613142.1 xanthine dehydrogenase accessory protein XdhC [Stappia taiwanensis]GGE80171.1 xanthine dehydrogenase accessory protein XdhC [Stappia taiwanensis]